MSVFGSLIKFLNDNNGTITLLATVIVASTTIVLAIITWWYAKTTDRMLKAGNTPEILLYLFPSETYSRRINLCIQNIGTGFASDINFRGEDLHLNRPFLFKVFH